MSYFFVYQKDIVLVSTTNANLKSVERHAKKNGKGTGETNMIPRVGINTDMLTSRGGLSLFRRYIEGITIRPILGRLSGSMHKKGNGFRPPHWSIPERKIILNVTVAAWKTLQLDAAWERCVSPPRFV